MKKTHLILFFLLVLVVNFNTRADDSNSALQNSQYHFLIDANTKEVLLSKNADFRIAPSSMTKLMTAYVVFDQIKKGYLALNKQCLIGKDAWRKSGSSMFLNYGDVVSIEELIKGLLVVSGNDAAVALAEAGAPDGIDGFVRLMNKKAKELGMKNSHFTNPHGLNHDGHYMTLRDIATLATRLYLDFPQYTHFLNMPEFTYGNIKQQNRNPLIKNNYDGVVAGKTGYTSDGGYGVVGIVRHDNRLLVGVINKAKNSKQRSELIRELFDYGFLKYKKFTVFTKGQTVSELDTWFGNKSKIAIATNQEVSFNLPRSKEVEDIKVVIKYKDPIYAPIVKGAKLGYLVIEVKDYKTFEYSLFAKETVGKAGYFERLSQVLHYKLNKFLEAAKISF